MNCGYKVTRPAFPRELIKQCSKPVEEVFRLPRWLLTWIGCSFGPILLGLFCEKKKKKKVGSILNSHTSEGNNSGTRELFEFPLMRTLARPLQGSASQGMTHIFEKAGQVRSSAQGQAQKDAQ